ncbi:MAG: hypothetical protein Kow0042_07480 [Calditrichia bacterium]
MEGFHYVDLFATKGLEYILVIGFLLVFALFWVYFDKPTKDRVKSAIRTMTGTNSWFHLAKGFYYHQGHTWVRPESAGVVKVGLDDFAQKFIGKPQSLILPEVGSRLEQGEEGWKLKINSREISMLSPVDGEIIAVNEQALRSPEIITEDPYHNGWLLKVQVPRIQSNLKNLLTGNLAVNWMEHTVNKLRQRMTGELGMVLQDGGAIVPGFGRELSPDGWEQLAAEFFLTKELPIQGEE